MLPKSCRKVVSWVLSLASVIQGGFGQLPNPSVWCPDLDPDVAKTFPVCLKYLPSADPASTETIIDPIFLVSGSHPLTGKLSADNVMTSNSLFEGDILGIEDADTVNLVKDLKLQANAIKDELKHWPDAIVPFRISASFRQQDKDIIVAAIAIFEQKTCLKFRPQLEQDADYVYFAPGFGCNSYVGRAAGRQIIALQVPACMTTGIINHEMMHAIGFYHEQSRTDRDDYVEINWDNIAKESNKEFHKYTDAEITAFGEPYDYSSVMHYGTFDFAKNREVWTIRPRPEKVQSRAITIGQRDGLSEIDLRKIRALYKCPVIASACSNGWIAAGPSCYFLSFQANQNKLGYIGARNFCRKNKALISTASADGAVNLILSAIKSRGNLDESEPIWVAGCQIISVNSPTPQDADDCSQLLHFVCEKTLE